jgi:hypothetical protein
VPSNCNAIEHHYSHKKPWKYKYGIASIDNIRCINHLPIAISLNIIANQNNRGNSSKQKATKSNIIAIAPNNCNENNTNATP